LFYCLEPITNRRLNQLRYALLLLITKRPKRWCSIALAGVVECLKAIFTKEYRL
jgi:hypothetical protein